MTVNRNYPGDWETFERECRKGAFFAWLDRSALLRRLSYRPLRLLYKLLWKSHYEALFLDIGAMQEKFLTPEALTDKMLRRRNTREIFLDHMFYKIDAREYFVYHYANLSVKGKLSYMTEVGRHKYLDLLNARETAALLDDKYRTYCRLSEYFGREAILIQGPAQRKLAEDFLRRHGQCVVKPLDSACGQGVELLDGSDPDEALEHILRAAPCIAEERIIQCAALAKLNPSSVNTVRMVTVLTNGGQVIVHRPFFRIGRAGSIVDNGGAGGMFARIDEKTGVLCSPGMDELGNRFLTHPDTGEQIIGFRLPEWDAALALAQRLAPELPDARYVGWDFALTDRGWVVVEGNAHTQFIGQQLTAGTGMRRELEALIGLLDDTSTAERECNRL